MYSLNQLKKDLVGFFGQHAQINQVLWVQSESDINAANDKDYPAVAIIYNGSRLNGNYFAYSFRVVLIDRVRSIEDMETEVISDCLLITEDFFAWLHRQRKLTFNIASDIAPVRAKFLDGVTGIEFDININVHAPMNSCAIPTRD